MDGIKKAAQTLKPDLDKLKGTLSGVFEKGLTPVFQSLKPLFPLITTGLSNSAKSLILLADGIASVVRSADGMTLLRNIFNGVSVSLALIKPGILDIVDSFLLLAGRSSMFDGLTNAINTFGAAWRSNLIDNINNGSLDAAFRGLGDLLGSVTEGLASLVHNGIEVFATAAPGVTATVDALTNFFNKFDWASLGASVGSVFQGLADAINNVPQGTVDEIAAAFGRMGDAFKDPAFTAGLTDIATRLPGVIDLITNFATEFVKAVDAIAIAVDRFAAFNAKFEEFVTKTNDSFTQLGKDLGIGEGSSFSQWLNDADDSIDRFLGIIPPKAENLGRETGSGLANGISSTSPAALRAIENATQPIPATVQQNLGQVPQIAQSALAPLPPTAEQIFLQLQPVMQGALAGLATTAQLGFASVAAAVAQGGPAMIAAITTAFVGTDVAVTTAFGLMAQKAREGLVLVANAITEGFQTIVFSAFDVAFVGVGDKFVELGTLMATKMTEGLELVRQAAITKVLEIDDVFLKSQQVWVSLIQVGAGLMATYWTTGLQTMLDTTAAFLASISTQFFNFALNVTLIMVEAMNQMNVALTAGFATAQGTVDAGIAAMVASLQGAVSQFREAGSNMGAALAEGLRSRQGEVEAAAAALANAAAAAVRAAAVIRSPSKVFDHLGQMVGKGFAGGMWRTIGLIKSVSVGMVQAVFGSFSKLTDTSGVITDILKDVAPTVQSQTSVFASGSNLNIDDSGMADIGTKVSEALATWTVEIDQQGIAKLVNKQNRRNARR
jgi:hypothetical protein